MLALVPVQLAAIAVQVAIFAAQLFSFMPRCRVVPVVESAPPFAPVAPAIFGKHRACAQSDQQQNSSYRAFHVRSPFVTAARNSGGHSPGSRARKPRLLHANPPARGKFRDIRRATSSSGGMSWKAGGGGLLRAEC